MGCWLPTLTGNALPNRIIRSNKKQARESTIVTTRKESYRDTFMHSTKQFEDLCKQMEHGECSICQKVSLRVGKDGKCDYCRKCAWEKNMWRQHGKEVLPVWYQKGDVQKQNPQCHVPEELTCLREGEKFLIQIVSVVVPVHHMKFGQVGCKGHIVSFPQRVSDMATILPRLPKETNLVRVIKRYKTQDGGSGQHAFIIRRKNVLTALQWLKEHNPEYANIEIDSNRLDWIGNREERELTASYMVDTIVDKPDRNDDRGPSEEQVAEVAERDRYFEDSYGMCSEGNIHLPKSKDAEIIDGIKEAGEVGKEKLAEKTGSRPTITFPYVSPDPTCEYTDTKLMEKAFPWLFPGGTGGYGTLPTPKPKIHEWLEQIQHYKVRQSMPVCKKVDSIHLLYFCRPVIWLVTHS